MKHGWTKQTLLAGLFLMGCESEEAPVSCAAFGDTAIPIHVPDQYAVRFCFTDENGDALTVRAKSSEPKTVHLWTRPVDSPSPEEAILEALAPGASTITITATDPGGLSATEMFRVIVPNRMPVLVKPLRQLDKKVGQKVRVDLPGHFTDPDLEVLTYEAWVTDASVAAVRRTGGTVIVEALAPGSTVLVARAADPAGLAAVDSADVSVVSATLKIGSWREYPSLSGDWESRSMPLNHSTVSNPTLPPTDIAPNRSHASVAKSSGRCRACSSMRVNIAFGSSPTSSANMLVPLRVGLRRSGFVEQSALHGPPSATGSSSATVPEGDLTARTATSRSSGSRWTTPRAYNHAPPQASKTLNPAATAACRPTSRSANARPCSRAIVRQVTRQGSRTPAR